MVNAIPSVQLNKTEVCRGKQRDKLSDFVKYEWIFNGEVLNTVETQNWIVPGVSGTYSVTGWTSAWVYG